MLTNDEIKLINDRLGRAPNVTETHVFDAMWSEHCSYKSSKFWLKQLYTEGKQVISGPGENAGVVDIGDNDKLVFKIESHNHPSYIEPYQGAATGVGGIMRDIFTMGARPIANLNSLHFGSTNDRRVIDGVVKGIADYGNCVGVPTVNSKCHFFDCYRENPLVNAMTVGYTNKKIFTVLKSPHVNKKSREQFELNSYKRLLDILDPNARTIDDLTNLNVPAGVDISMKL